MKDDFVHMPIVKKWLEAALHIPALSRALHCDELDMFNQPNKTEISPELLLQLGKTTDIRLKITTQSVIRKNYQRNKTCFMFTYYIFYVH